MSGKNDPNTPKAGGDPNTQQATPAATPNANANAEPKNEPAQEGVNPLTVDINAAIEKARQQEKQKLYGELERSKAEAAAARAQLANVNAALEAISKKEEELKKGQPEPINKGNEPAPKGPDVDVLINTAITAALKKAEEMVFGPKISALEAQVSGYQKDLLARDLASYRESLIAANKDSIVPELVTGGTRDELELSLARAKQAFAQIAETVAATLGKSGTIPLPPVSGGKGKVTNGTEVLSSVGSMSLAEYSAKRTELLKAASEAAKAAYSNQG